VERESPEEGKEVVGDSRGCKEVSGVSHLKVFVNCTWGMTYSSSNTVTKHRTRSPVGQT
jgi:hypothetical protein